MFEEPTPEQIELVEQLYGTIPEPPSDVIIVHRPYIDISNSTLDVR